MRNPVNSDIPTHFLHNQNPHPYVWVSEDTVRYIPVFDPPSASIEEAARSVLTAFKDGVQ